jgi:HK97 family phage portal protein
MADCDIETVPVTASLVDDYSPYSCEGQDQGRAVSTSDMYIWMNKLPELYGIISAICDDILGDSVDFRGTKQGVAQAEQFSARNHFRKKLYSVLQDMVLTGDGYMGVKAIDSFKFQRMVEPITKSIGLEYDETLEKKLRARNPEVFLPREVFVLKASTIKINYDKHGVVQKYTQKVRGVQSPVYFSRNEVVHLSLNNIGGDVYGNSGFYSALNDIATLWYAKDYAGTWFQNDGSPEKIWNLEETNPNSKEFKQFKEQLKHFKAAKNKHKSLVTTGKTSFQNVNEFGKDLDFANLINVFTQRLLMLWNMPPSRLSDISGNYKASKGSEAGYYKKINRIQGELEETLNNELWYQFGNVKMKFKRAYKRDDSVEADIVAKTVGRPVMTPNEGRIYLGHEPINEAWADELKPDFTEQVDGKMNEAKTEEETGNQHESSADKQKLAKRGTVMEVPIFNQFKAIVESDGRTWMSSKVFYDEDSEAYNFYFGDSVAMYETRVEKSLISDPEGFQMKYLDYALKGKLKTQQVTVEI